VSGGGNGWRAEGDGGDPVIVVGGCLASAMIVVGHDHRSDHKGRDMRGDVIFLKSFSGLDFGQLSGVRGVGP
jgi:hypothetical protein